MNTTTAAAQMLNNPEFRFTIRTLDGRVLRKAVSAERFLVVRRKYSTTEVRVDVTHLKNDSIQTWNLGLTKWFGSN